MQKIIFLTIAILYFNFSLSAEEITGEESNPDYCYQIIDPWEPMNRATFAFNDVIDTALMGPFVLVYTNTLPQWSQDRIHNFFDFLRSPVTLLNNTLQLDGEAASKTIGRMITNFFLGFAGAIDVASYFDDMDPNPQGFDDTLSYYNVPYGYYFVIPILGPSTIRGAPSKAVDVMTNPTEYALVNVLHSVYYTVASSAEMRIANHDAIAASKATSVDYYSKIRSAYIQYISNRSPHCKTQSISANDFVSALENTDEPNNSNPKEEK